MNEQTTVEVEEVVVASKGTCIETVSVEEREDGIDITILADGTIQEYSAFTVDNPPRIVFDIFNISKTAIILSSTLNLLNTDASCGK